MIGQAIEIPSDAMLTERTASTRHRKEIYVFPVHHDVNLTQKPMEHIAKLASTTFLAFGAILKLFDLFCQIQS